MPSFNRLTRFNIQLEQPHQLIEMLQVMLTLRTPILHCVKILTDINRVNDFRRYLFQYVDTARPALDLADVWGGGFGGVEFGVDDAGAGHSEVDTDHYVRLPDVTGRAADWCWHGGTVPCDARQALNHRGQIETDVAVLLTAQHLLDVGI